MSRPLTAASYFAKAERALCEAQALLQQAATEGACSRAYYAMFDAAHAALIATGHELPTTPIKTHHMLIAAFGMQLVKTGRVDPGLGRDLNQVQDMRLLADYSAEPPVLDDATWAVQQAEAFVIAMRMLVTDVPPV